MSISGWANQAWSPEITPPLSECQSSRPFEAIGDARPVQEKEIDHRRKINPALFVRPVDRTDLRLLRACSICARSHFARFVAGSATSVTSHDRLRLDATACVARQTRLGRIAMLRGRAAVLVSNQNLVFCTDAVYPCKKRGWRAQRAGPPVACNSTSDAPYGFCISCAVMQHQS